MARYCAGVGVYTDEDLARRGYLNTYLALKENHPKIMNRMALYALYGALHDVNCLKLPTAIKETLEKELQQALSTRAKGAQNGQNIPLSSELYRQLP